MKLFVLGTMVSLAMLAVAVHMQGVPGTFPVFRPRLFPDSATFPPIGPTLPQQTHGFSPTLLLLPVVLLAVTFSKARARSSGASITPQDSQSAAAIVSSPLLATPPVRG